MFKRPVVVILALLWCACPAPTKPALETCPPLPDRKAAATEPAAALRPAPPTTLFQGATVWTAAGQVLQGADVLVRDGRIAEVGQGLEVPAGALVVPGSGKHLTPGLIDPHSHVGVYSAPGLLAHADGNEIAKPLSPAVRAVDALWPQDPALPRALAAGVTALHVIPGSGNLVGGEGVVIRPLPGRAAQDLRLADAPRTLKMACGENPKRIYADKGGPFSRMGNVARVRQAFIKAREYRRKWARHEDTLKKWTEEREKRCSGEPTGKPAWARQDFPPAPPERDLAMETLAAVLDGTVRVHMHCYRADEMALMLRLARELGFTIGAFHHAVEAYKVRDLLAQAGTGAVVWINWWGYKAEMLDAIPENAALLGAAGATAALHSDSPLVVQRMHHEAAQAYFRGQDAGIPITEDQAIRLITAGPAKLLGILDRTGTIEKGKLADLVLWDGHPFSVFTRTDRVMVEGRLLFDRSADATPRATDFELGMVPRPAPMPATKKTAAPKLPAGWPARAPRLGGGGKQGPREVKATVIRGATVHTMTGPPIEDGAVVMVNGRITAVGSAAANAPAGARFINGSGMVLTPGLVAAETTLGMVEINLEKSARDHRPDGKGLPLVRADLRAWEALNPASAAILITRRAGFTSAIIRPAGGLVSGQSAAFDLAGLRAPENRLTGPTAVHVALGTRGGNRAGGSRALALMRLRRLLQDARALKRLRKETDARKVLDLSAPLNQVRPMVPVVEGKVPLVVTVDRAADILAVLRLAATQKVRVALEGAAEGWKVADDIARAGAPVLVRVDRNLPASFDALGARYDNAARLHAAGVVVGISAGGSAHNVRFLRQAAGLAAAWGLPRRAALAAISRVPAAIFGLGDRGVIRPGALANIAVWTGDPLELSTRVRQLYIGGQEVDLATRQTALRDRYLKLGD